MLLAEIARLYNYLMKQEEILSPKKIKIFSGLQNAFEEFSYLVELLKQDPVSCYLELKKSRDNMKAQLEQSPQRDTSTLEYMRTIEKFLIMLESTHIIRRIITGLSHTSVKDREVYKTIFRPEILPNFTFTRLASQLPAEADFVDQYEIKTDDETATVTILRQKNDPKFFYHVMPPEYTLSEEHHLLLNLARNVLMEHRPKSEEFTDPERTRQVFFNVARDMLTELAKNQNVSISNHQLNKLAKILVRHTIGFGPIEVLMMDEKLQDIVLNAPITQNPIFVRHEKYEQCTTNIIPSFEDADSWAAKLRLQSGRPLDEANPILDTDLAFEKARARVAAITEPLSPNGLAYAIRRHRDKPWTLPLYIDKKMLNPLAAGLLSFFIDGSRTLLVAGTRSAGKTSLLSSLMLEILSKYRTIVVEDTLELPVDYLRKVGYDILRMKVRSALVEGSTEISAADGIRTSLRLGDSALIVGEVRSEEAKALYEAMRVGALANVVAGTIHGDSPYGVFDRVVNDLSVPPTSFKATDIIVIVNPIKTPDGMHMMRRIVQITEVRKHWQSDPLEEKGFVDLMRYNVETDSLEPTPELINGDSEIIKSIAGSVKGWAGNWDAVYDNILLRGMIKEEIVKAAYKFQKPDLMEADFNVLANHMFHHLVDETRKEKGSSHSSLVFPLFKNWLYQAAESF